MIKHYANNFVSYICSKLFIKEIHGISNMPKEGGFIIAANHTSYLDIPVIYSALLNKNKRYIRFIAKKELLKDALFRIFILLLEYKPNKLIIIDKENPEKALNEARIALKNKEVVGIYPEGGRSHDGNLTKGKTGVARLALLAKAPVVPLGISGTFELMPSDKSLPKIKKIVKLNIGKPMYFKEYYGKKTNKKIRSESQFYQANSRSGNRRRQTGH